MKLLKVNFGKLTLNKENTPCEIWDREGNDITNHSTQQSFITSSVKDNEELPF